MKKTILTLLLFSLGFLLPNTKTSAQNWLKAELINKIKTTETARAKAFLRSVPVTVTDSYCKRSSGGIHDFYSEGDYWWPDPQNADGPYIRRDGQTNPGNFTAHRHAMVRLSEIVATLTSAFLLENNQIYADKAWEHLNAWFVDSASMMNPNMLYAQAIYGKVSGRGIGLIDAYHLVEVAQSVKMLEAKNGITPQQAQKVKRWFSEFLHWMTTHKYGIDEMNAKNNHGTCWIVTAASMANLVNNSEIKKMCTERFKTILLPTQMASNGSFPMELARTKPYGYSLFNIDAFCNAAQILSTPNDNLFEFTTPDGKSLKKGLEFIYPFIADKTKWPYKKDIFIWDEWPVRQSGLLFGGIALNKKQYIDTWLKLPAYPVHNEVIRNLPVRHPIIWFAE